MKSKLKRCITAMAAFAALASFGAFSAAAGEPYDSYNYDRWGEAVPSQAGFTAERSVSGYDLGVGAFDNPSDIFCDHEHIFYIADTGNNRIVAVDTDFDDTVNVYDSFTMPDGSSTHLKDPQGVFVSEHTGLMYIADNENSRVLVTKPDGTAVMEITKPDSEVYDQSKTFLPQKVIADKAGNESAIRLIMI